MAEVNTLKVKANDIVRAGVHANIVWVSTTSNEEVMLDFIFTHPMDKDQDGQIGTLLSRVVLPVKIAKELMLIMQTHLGKSKKE